MHDPRWRRLRLAALAAVAAAPLAAAGADPGLAFERAFGDRGEPRTLHYQVTYVSAGAVHRLEVWRDGQVRVKRRTDDAAELYATRLPGEAEFALSALDLRRRIRTDIRRTNLYRLGSFTDWFDLAHGLRHPVGAYTLAAERPPAGSPVPLAPCAWYRLARGADVRHVCWGRRDRIPLLILDANGAAVWTVTSVDRAPLPPGTFAVPEEGYVRNDADGDIEGD